MKTAQNGDTVKVHYHGKLTDGTTFDSSEGREPLEFTIGSGQVIKGFDEGVKGLGIGEKRTINIPVEEAYGPKQDDLLIEFPKDQFPEGMEPAVGMALNMRNEQGQAFPVTIAEIKEASVVLDGNHPLAGKELVFDLELVEIVGEKSGLILPD
ncbi:FKBP-type peptidyl-prolyl cis-trans isomerase [Rhizosphaericola mali]|uniref:Peptidyl-prolyl cis-trans isomerase n=1 Tax=Rhizosphaericola mali TaxID=2545455 RepID=A0A5P2G3S9_9BACT|nr:peptidylprolyl isomerase [Rhizosphaericola mali]QES90135.1 peptidylprolyl isomerase [Rhizosphaericola mali]